ncbi:MAG: hypothetical protein Q8880_10345 [Bacteroidota bacterium]|nr:hypothetical protein [Bacteroidota bacterium]
MKANFINKIASTLIKLGIIILLIIGASTRQEYSFYILLRWIVFIGSGYFIINTIIEKKYQLLILFLSIGILFNPLKSIYMQKHTWHLIDYIVAGIFLLIILYDWYVKKD